MQIDLDIIAKGNKIWYNLCNDCLADIDECSKELKTIDKKIINIDENHVFMIGKYGPVIKKTVGETTSFINCKKDIDMDKLENGEYSLEDIAESQTNQNKIIGKYKSDNVILKKGKYGHYIECGSIKKSLNGVKKELDDLTIDDVIPIIENKVTVNSSIIREINQNTSIRIGKFGDYIYHKTANMTKPKFIKLKGFKGNYKTCPKDEIEQYVSKN